MNQNFFSLINIMTLSLALLFIVFGILTIKKNKGPWGRKIFVTFALGLIVCLLAAFRDGYGLDDNAIIPFVGSLSTIFSLLGLTIVIGFSSSLFIKNIHYRQLIYLR